MNLASINLQSLILGFRQDLKRKFSPCKLDTQTGFVQWIITSGINEYKSVSLNQDLINSFSDPSISKPGFSNLQLAIWNLRTDLHRVFSLPQDNLKYIEWFYIHGVGEHHLWPWLTKTEKHRVCFASGPWQSRFIQNSIDESLTTSDHSANLDSKGVNLIGYVNGQLGIGEDVRMAALALDKVGIDLSLVNFKPGHDIPQQDITFSDRVIERGLKPVNIFCLTAIEHGRFYAERGPSQLTGRYNIGYWPWELSRWPIEWIKLINLVDEVWVSSRHTFKALSQISASLNPPIKILHMPLAVPVQSFHRADKEMEVFRSQIRMRYFLPQKACLFCFSFDLNSSIDRKNPQAVIKSFLKAFPIQEGSSLEVGLVIKVHPPKKPFKAWNAVKELARSDKRLHIVEETLPRSELLAMYQACDAFVSLHRAEGFGRGIAEALQLGLRVITTDYSGNVDFCRRPEFSDRVKLIPFRLIKVRPGQYPYNSGQVWASPNVDAASIAIREVANDVFANKGNLLPVPEGGWQVFSELEVGSRYKKRLVEIYQEMGL